MKDRFNSLLCQKVAEFEDRVKQLQSDPQPDGREASVSADSGSGGHVMQDVCVYVCVCVCVYMYVSNMIGEYTYMTPGQLHEETVLSRNFYL